MSPTGHRLVWALGWVSHLRRVKSEENLATIFSSSNKSNASVVLWEEILLLLLLLRERERERERNLSSEKKENESLKG